MPEPRYGSVKSSVGRGGPPSGQQRRDGVVAVKAKRPMEEPVSRPRTLDDVVDADGVIWREGNGTRSPQGNSTEPMCRVCGATEPSEVVVRIEKINEVALCGACIELLVDALRAELPRRRLRLAMERLASGTVSIEMVEQVERLAGYQTAKAKDNE